MENDSNADDNITKPSTHMIVGIIFCIGIFGLSAILAKTFYSDICVGMQHVLLLEEWIFIISIINVIVLIVVLMDKIMNVDKSCPIFASLLSKMFYGLFLLISMVIGSIELIIFKNHCTTNIILYVNMAILYLIQLVLCILSLSSMTTNK